MNEGMISKRYAKALLLYAIDQKTEDVVYSEMKRLAASFAREPQLRMVMDNPLLNMADKLALVKAAIGGIVSNESVRFIELVLKKRREVKLRFMALSYIDLYYDYKHINTGKLVTAVPVDDVVIEKMKGLLRNVKTTGTLNFETSVDPSIGGGFILYVDTYRLDASVTNQLKRIKQQLVAENRKVL